MGWDNLSEEVAETFSSLEGCFSLGDLVDAVGWHTWLAHREGVGPKICACGKEFQPLTAQVYCSLACAPKTGRRYVKQQRVEKTCARAKCGKSFAGVPNKTFCNPKCQQLESSRLFKQRRRQQKGKL